MGPEDMQVADEVLARVRAATLDKAMKRLQNEEGVRTFKNLMCVDPGHFVFVKASGELLCYLLI